MKQARLHYLTWPLLVIAVTFLVVYLIFGVIVLHPNSRLIMDNQDGRQIYFNILYHVKFGSGFVLSNQNYPYYECIFMTDAQAMLAFVLNFIQHHWFPVEHYVIGIINGLIFYSIPLCSLFLFLIFRNLQIRPWMSALFAVILCFLSPQMLRITAGHYGLSYLFYFPLLIYLLIRILDERSLIHYILVFILVMFFGLNNGHLSFAGSLLLLVFGFVTWLYQFRSNQKRGITIFSLGLVCLLCFYIIIRHYDPVTDREAIPWGFLYYYAQFESIYLPFAGKVLELYQGIIPIKIAIPQEEGIAYIGIAGCLFTLFLVFRTGYFLYRKKFNRLLRITLNPKINILLISGFLMLLYSMAFPFRFGMENVLDGIPFIRQFRSPGRFAWVFYYMFSIYLVYTFHLIIRSKRVSSRRYITPVLTSIIVLLYIQDISDYTIWYKRYLGDLTYFDNVFAPKKAISDSLEKFRINRQAYSSIYGIPVCNQWNSKFGREEDQYKLVTVMLNISYNTGLPWINSKLSRVSTSQTMASGQFVSHPLITRDIQPLIDSNKKILLIHLKEYEPLPSEQYVIDQSTKLFEDETYRYYSFQFRPGFYALRDSLQKHFDQNLTESLPSKDALIAKGSVVLKYPGIDDQDIAVSDRQSDKLILDTMISKPEIDGNMEFSIWSKVDYRTDGAPYIKIVRSTPDKQVLDIHYLHSARVIDIQHGMLKMDYHYLQTLPQEKMSVFILKGNDHRFERLLIKPQNFNFYHRLSDKRMFNNYLLD